MIINIGNVYVSSVLDLDEEILEEEDIKLLAVCGEGLHDFCNEYDSNYSIKNLYFPLRDRKSQETLTFIKTIINAVDNTVRYWERSKKEEDKRIIGPNVLFCCAMGLSRSPYVASRLLTRLNNPGYDEKVVRDYYYQFKKQNPSIKSVFVE